MKTRVVKEMPARPSPIEPFLDGRVHEIVVTNGKAEINRLRTAMYMATAARGQKLVTRVVKGVLYVQAVKEKK